MHRLVLGGALALGSLGGCRTPPEPDRALTDSPRDEPNTTASPAPEPTPAPTCEGQPCDPPRECISYFGIAGPQGPTFHSCELRCSRDAEADACPEGTRCVTVADGPGDVCR